MNHVNSILKMQNLIMIPRVFLRFTITLFMLTVFTVCSDAQSRKNSTEPIFSFKNGLGITSPDSIFSINIRFRFQNRFLMNTKSQTDFSPASWEARVRRARMSFTGYVFDPRFSYYMQLSFARGDLDWIGQDDSNQNSSPNIVRDAMIFYRPNARLQLGFGQGKLPGNRQRVVSSGSLQFFDRSPANAAYTLDRDFGIFATYFGHFSGDFLYILKGCISSGEGRNSVASNSGLAYTLRAEFLPLGEFMLGGDYFEGDVAGEPTPKISFGIGAHYNDLAVRTQGQLGRDLYAPKSFSTLLADFLFKYQGLALSAEYLQKQSFESPVTINKDGQIRDLIIGSGLNTQLSYCFPNLWELASRFSVVNPAKEIQARNSQVHEYGIGITKYFMVHKTKAQFNIFSRNEKNLVTIVERKFFYFVFQLEAGI